MKQDKSCWACGWHKPGGTTLLGKCSWFVEVKKEVEPKEVPSKIVDTGCKFWKEKDKYPV